MKFVKLVFVVVILLSVALPVAAQKIIPYNQKVFTFGHVGVDFTVKHKFYYFNETDKPVHILDVTATCDCSMASTNSNVVNPGDTIFFDLTFETKDYYGPTNKSIIVKTDHPEHSEIKYHYVSIVGQWYNGLKPLPSSYFFLPGKELKPVRIMNLQFEKIEIVDLFKYDNSFEIKMISDKADKEDFIEFEIIPSDDNPKGTIKTTLTVSIKKAGVDDLTYLTIPIKIVKY